MRSAQGYTTAGLCMLCLILLIPTTPTHAWFWGRNNEVHTYHACGVTLDVLVSEVCADVWHTRCDTTCRRKRAAEGFDRSTYIHHVSLELLKLETQNGVVLL